MKPGVWRHLSTLDMDMLVIRQIYTHKARVELTVRYLDRKGRFYLWGSKDTVFVHKDDLWKWSKME